MRKEKSYLAHHNRHASRAMTAQTKRAIALKGHYPQMGALYRR